MFCQKRAQNLVWLFQPLGQTVGHYIAKIAPQKSLIWKCIRKLDFVTNVTDFLAVQDGNKNLISII